MDVMPPTTARDAGVGVGVGVGAAPAVRMGGVGVGSTLRGGRYGSLLGLLLAIKFAIEVTLSVGGVYCSLSSSIAVSQSRH